MSVTQQDIADRVGVSRRAISYALNGDNRVGKEMREKILAVAQELGYQTHLSAKALVTGRTYQVALGVPTLTNPFHTEFIRYFEAHTRHTPYQLLITTRADKGQSLSQLNVDGYLLHDCLPAQPLSRPAVLLQSPPHHRMAKECGSFDQVFLNLTQAAREAMTHLLARRTRRVAFVTLSPRTHTDEPRYQAYLQAMKQAGLAAEVISLASYDVTINLRSFTCQVAGEYCRQHGVPDAFFCMNDEIAIGIYRLMRALDVSIPGQVAVVGCDDIPETEDMWPPLTTIAHSWEEFCGQAWEMLMSRIENPELSARKATCRSELIIRGSSVTESQGV